MCKYIIWLKVPNDNYDQIPNEFEWQFVCDPDDLILIYRFFIFQTLLMLYIIQN